MATKKAKKRATKYELKLKIKTSFDKAMKIAFTPKG